VVGRVFVALPESVVQSTLATKMFIIVVEKVVRVPELLSKLTANPLRKPSYPTTLDNSEGVIKQIWSVL